MPASPSIHPVSHRRFWAGAGFGLLVLSFRLRAESDRATIGSLGRQSEALGKLLFMSAALGTLLFGVLMVAKPMR